METIEKVSYVKSVEKGRIEIMANIAELQKLDEPYEDENYREPLSVDTQVVKKILLSWGGPANGFSLYFDVNNQDGEETLSRGVYWRQDWGEYQETRLSDGEAELVFQFYLGGEI